MLYRIFVPIHHQIIDRRVDPHAEHEGVVTISADIRADILEWCAKNLAAPVSRDRYHRTAPRISLMNGKASYVDAIGTHAVQIRFGSDADRHKFASTFKFRGI